MNRLLGVIALMLVVLLASAGSAVFFAASRAFQRRPGRLSRVIAYSSWSLLGVGLLCFLYGEFLEADWLEVTVVVVPSKKLALGQHVTIAHVSDLHVDRDSRALMALEKALRDLQPDLLVFTGDALNAREGVARFRQVISSANARLGRFAVRGNHDVYRWREVDLFGGGIATELLSDEPLVIDNGRMALCGAPFGSGDVLEACVRRAPQDALTIAAYHSPDEVEALKPRPDLYLAGHTHGGQVRVPFYGAVITFSRFDKRYEMGRYEVNGTTLYVNRGIGFEPFAPRVRFLSRPELTIIQVVPASDSVSVPAAGQ